MNKVIPALIIVATCALPGLANNYGYQSGGYGTPTVYGANRSCNSPDISQPTCTYTATAATRMLPAPSEPFVHPVYGTANGTPFWGTTTGNYTNVYSY